MIGLKVKICILCAILFLSASVIFAKPAEKEETVSGKVEIIEEDEEGKPVIDLEKCDNDGLCISACPTGSLVTQKQGWHVYVGGRFGKKPELGKRFKNFIDDEEVFSVTRKVIDAYRALGKKSERLGVLINRVGLDEFKAKVEGNG